MVRDTPEERLKLENKGHDLSMRVMDLVAPLGHAGLLLVSTGLLLATLVAARHLLGWRDLHGRPEDGDDPPQARIGAPTLRNWSRVFGGLRRRRIRPPQGAAGPSSWGTKWRRRE